MRSLYTAASGMNAQQTRLDTVANNLANVNTTGFKKGRADFQDVFYQELTAGGQVAQGARAEVGSGVRLSGLQRNHTAGTLTHTGDGFHMAIVGEGFFELETPDGELVYTRDGTFSQDNEGTLVNASGYKLAGDFQLTPGDLMEVLEDGTVQVTRSDDPEPVTIGVIEVKQFTNASGLKAMGGNLFVETAESGEATLPPQGQNAIRQGYLEGSNVDAAEELVTMILAQRAYELNSKVIQAADETMQVAANLRR